RARRDAARRRVPDLRLDRERPRRPAAPHFPRRGRSLHQCSRRGPAGHGRPVSAGPVAVVGAGTMGHGIAYAVALAGFEVRLTDSRAEAIPAAIRKIGDLLQGGVERGKLSQADLSAVATRLRPAPDLAAAVRDADVVIEAVVEDLGVKRRLFTELERAAPGEALLATNTSSLSVAAVADGVRDPSRVVGVHFFNPVHAMK